MEEYYGGIQRLWTPECSKYFVHAPEKESRNTHSDGTANKNSTFLSSGLMGCSSDTAMALCWSLFTMNTGPKFTRTTACNGESAEHRWNNQSNPDLGTISIATFM